MRRIALSRSRRAESPNTSDRQGSGRETRSYRTPERARTETRRPDVLQNNPPPGMLCMVPRKDKMAEPP